MKIGNFSAFSRLGARVGLDVNLLDLLAFFAAEEERDVVVDPPVVEDLW